VYLACENAAATVECARHAGGELVMEPRLLTNIGVIAAIRDLDHNVIGLHAAT
jgi:predicted enzyme related to lactoylglutathione lyase